MSQPPSPGYESTMATRSEVLEVKEDQSTWHSVFSPHFLPHKKKLMHRIEEGSTRPGLRQDGHWQVESDGEQLSNSTEMAVDSLGAFEAFP